MQSDDIIRQVFQRLSEDPQNTRCMDCDSLNPEFASINHGILICSTCASIHTNLGAISIVKPKSNDLWSIDQLRMMAAGGNSAFKEYLAYYDMDQATPIDIKYRTRAAAFYRSMLQVISKNEPFEEDFLPHEIGIMIGDYDCNQSQEEIKVENPSEEIKIREEAVNCPDLPDDSEEQIMQSNSKPKKGLKGWLNKAYKSSVKAGNVVANKLNELAQTPAVKKLEEKSLVAIHKIADKCKEISEKPKIKAATDKIVNGAKKSYNKINSNPTVCKIKKDTMKFLVQIENEAKAGAKSAINLVKHKPESDIQEIEPTEHLEIMKE
ncbi:unnamed protein product [Blepharisma stoltei]|uniref:Arf-GAP domain-containing protein n=1 Tax=Blepharisma stoltei TaxID=1481888 RepID=A0AAU9IJM5_9CILI|nr:unnamed protein product [Blepharisma stoltei]